jgi:predicted ATPase/class 3 adenylate cyclase
MDMNQETAAKNPSRSPPGGTVTFLFTDIEGSTDLWQRHRNTMASTLGQHDSLMRRNLEAHKGHVFKTVGDSFCAAFENPVDAANAAVAVQRAIRDESWEVPDGLSVRVALHAGTAELRSDDYFGTALSRVARILAVGHGGQILLSSSVRELLLDDLPEGLQLRDLGQHRLKDLIRPEHIFQILTPDLPNHFSALRTLDSRPNNLPTQPTAFVGRQREIELLRALLEKTARLVTLTGPGGSGKTRLGFQAAAELLDQFDHGVYFVPLASIRDPALVASTIAQTLAIREIDGRPLLENLKERLRGERILLILDNFEHVLAAAPMVGELLAGCPNLKVLATSRASLHVRGEHEFPVGRLALPELHRLPAVDALSQYDAIDLFIQRAMEVQPDFALTTANALAVTEICTRLDGLPLAIELAAARVKLHSPSGILARLGNRLELLQGGACDLPPRQQTLRAAITWSHDLLDEEAKVLFRRLSVFAGGFSLEAAEVVCGDLPGAGLNTLRGIEILINFSLLRRDELEPRFSMLETIREYALESLASSDEEETIRARHLMHFLKLAEEAALNLTGPDQALWLARLEEEHDNIRAALSWSVQCGDLEDSARLAGGVWRFWLVHGHLSEGRRWFDRLLKDEVRLPPALRAQALDGSGGLAKAQGDYGRALAQFEEEEALERQLGDKRGIARACTNLASILVDRDERERAEALFENSLGLYREVGEKRGMAVALGNLGNIASRSMENERAKELFEKALALYREIGDKHNIAVCIHNLALVMHRLGDQGQAAAFFEQSLAVFRELDSKQGIAHSLFRMGDVEFERGDLSRAGFLFGEALLIVRELGHEGEISLVLSRCAALAVTQERWPMAARLFGSARRLLEAVGESFMDADERARYAVSASEARIRLGHQVFERLQAEGRSMELSQAISLALEAT